MTLVTLVTKVLTLPFLGDVQSPCSLYNTGTLSPAAPKKKGPRILVPYITRVLCPRPLRDFCLKLSLFLGLAPAPLLLFYIYPGGLSPAAPRIFDKWYRFLLASQIPCSPYNTGGLSPAAPRKSGNRPTTAEFGLWTMGNVSFCPFTSWTEGNWSLLFYIWRPPCPPAEELW